MPLSILDGPGPDQQILVPQGAIHTYGVSRYHVFRDVEPEFWIRSIDGAKTWPLWHESTIKRYVAERTTEQSDQVA